MHYYAGSTQPLFCATEPDSWQHTISVYFSPHLSIFYIYMKGIKCTVSNPCWHRVPQPALEQSVRPRDWFPWTLRAEAGEYLSPLVSRWAIRRQETLLRSKVRKDGREMVTNKGMQHHNLHFWKAGATNHSISIPDGHPHYSQQQTITSLHITLGYLVSTSQ